jgi:signal transduction histidine kinase/ligand-binding sensor domain-containing protein
MRPLYFIKSYKTLFTLIFLLGLTVNISGQNQAMVFTRYSKLQGLSDVLMNCILQDKQGFLWIGTWNGLNRYDGYKFKVYKSVTEDSTTISSDGVKLMAEDHNGRIWIICVNGLNIYDKVKDNFVRVCANNPVNGNYFTSIIVDSKGILWVGTYAEGLWMLDVNNSNDYSKIKPNFKKFKVSDNRESISSNYVRGIFEDNLSNIWVNASNKTIDLFNMQGFEHFNINIPGIDKQTLIITIQCEDNDGLFWLATVEAGLISWNRKKAVFKQFKSGVGDKLLKSNSINQVRFDKDGLLWISTNGGGISLYNTKNQLFESLVTNPVDPNSISSNAINFTFEDRSGVKWVGTYNQGLNKLEYNKTKFRLDRPNPFIKSSISHKSVTTFVEDKGGNLWIATDGGGINYLNRKTGVFKHYLHDVRNSNTLGSNVVVSLIQDFEGNLWAGTFLEGLDYYNLKQNKVIHYKYNPHHNSISENNIWALQEDHNHNIWIGTLEGTLNFFNRKTQKFYQFRNDPNDINSFIHTYMTSIYEDSRHYLWIATNLGLEMLKLDDFDFSKGVPKLKFNHYVHNDKKNSLSSSNVFCIFEDHEGNMWFGTVHGGINKLNIKTGEFTAFTTKDGLAHNIVKGIAEDNKFNLWLSTENGLSKFNPQTKTFRNFDPSDGLQDFYFSKACIETKDGTMFFGGPNGFNIFDSKDIPLNLTPPPIAITDFRIFNNSVKAGQKIEGTVILNQSITQTKELSLSYKVNYFSFEFAALDFTVPNKNKYAYIMEGFDNQWRYTDANNRIATYTNLDPGEYTFKVRASNNDGIWNENYTSIKVKILPPWWRAMWFKIIIIFFFILSIYLFYTLRIALYQQKQKELSILVKKRTQEITKANDILLERQTRIEEYAEELHNQTESLKEANDLLMSKQTLIETQAEQLNNTNQQLAILNSTKDRFFAIIAHDLRNPFHTVSGFTEILINDYKNLPPEKIERYLNLIHTSSTNGNNLLENLLQWSRSQTGRIAFDPARLNLFAIADETVNLLEGNALRKNIRINSLVDQNIILFADEHMLKTIFRNLVSNAIKFTSENGNISIKSVITGAKVEITVADTGVGIAPENIPKLFRIDTNITTKGTSSESGTGLGLILCKEFVEKHNGTIWVESKINKGSEFKFTLPLG